VEQSTFDGRADAVRHFNRFYTVLLNMLGDKYLRSLFSVTEARVIYELARHGPLTAPGLRALLGIEPAFASRILRRLARLGLAERLPPGGEREVVRLTQEGLEVFKRLDQRSTESVASLLVRLTKEEQETLLLCMRDIESLPGSPETGKRRIAVRTHGPGDPGWAAGRHGRLFFRELGWDEGHEAAVAARMAGFLRRRDPARERFLVAELEGRPAGCAMLSKRSGSEAVLELLPVEPGARRLGIGRRLVDEAVAFARPAGYRRVSLSVSHQLAAARQLFGKAGFKKTRREHVRDLGRYLAMERWELGL